MSGERRKISLRGAAAGVPGRKWALKANGRPADGRGQKEGGEDVGTPERLQHTMNALRTELRPLMPCDTPREA